MWYNTWHERYLFTYWSYDNRHVDDCSRCAYLHMFRKGFELVYHTTL